VSADPAPGSHADEAARTAAVIPASLAARMGAAHLRHRINVQVEHAAQVFGQGTTYFHLENLDWMLRAFRMGLRLTGLYRRGRRNARAVRLTENRVRLRRWPESLRGYRVMQISDTHLDLDPELLPILQGIAGGVACDLCVLTGDFRARTWGPIEAAVALNTELIRSVRCPVYGVLGNHDFIEMAPPLEAAGARLLLNEHVRVASDGPAFYLAGVDDAHFYLAENFHRAAEGIPDDAASIVLSHTPATYLKAAACGFDLMLSGHTHGGQVCLPGGWPILRNARCPRALMAGAWRFGSLVGYTSRGTGSSGVPARFFCPPEITVHVIEPAD